MSIYAPVSKKTVKYPTLNEQEFYEVYLTLDNISKTAEDRVPPSAIFLLAYFMAKPKDYVLQFNSRRKGEKRFAAGTGFTSNYTNHLMTELRKRGLIYVGDDNIYYLNDDLRNIQNRIKECLKSFDAVPFEYVFTAVVVEDEELNETNIPTSSGKS